MNQYMEMSKADKIAYAKKNVSPETIISYQNAIGMAMNPVFGINTLPVRGFTGNHKTDVGLVIQSIPNSSDSRLSIIKDNGQHVSTYTVTQKKLIKIVQDGFWVLKTRHFN